MEIKKVENTSIFNRKGKLVLSRKMVLEANENVLKELFSNFFPIDIDRYHRVSFWDSIMYFGISPHFEECEEATVAPEYQIVFKTGDDGIVSFEKMEKIEHPILCP